jgi:uncharacterized membrane protein
MSVLSIKQITAIVIMGVLVIIASMVFIFPIPASSAYFNFSDTIIIITALIFGPIVGALAGGLGSGLAEFLGEWNNLVIYTTVIRGAEGYVAGHLAGDSTHRTIQKTLIAWVGGTIVMLCGYFIVNIFIYSFNAALTELYFNVWQMLVAGVLGIPVSIALKDRLRL